MNETPSSHTPPREAIRTVRIGLSVIVLIVLISLAFAGWKDIYTNFLEHRSPVITVLEFPRGGIGSAPTRATFRFSDSLSGLGEVAIIIEAKGKVTTISKKALDSVESYEETVEFQGEKSNLAEGSVNLIVSARDSSLWRNQVIETYPIKIDFQRPKVEVVAAPITTRLGGSGVVFYKASDDHLLLSGVKIGARSFPGFKAKGIDSTLEDPSLYVSLFAIDASIDLKNIKPRVFAEDEVGNANSTPLNITVSRRVSGTSLHKLSDDYIRDTVSPLVDSNLSRIEEQKNNLGTPLVFTSERNTEARELEKARLFVTTLKDICDNDIVSLLSRSPIYPRYWEGYFLRQPGTLSASFGDKLAFSTMRGPLVDVQSNSIEFLTPRDNRDIYAVNDGIVISSDMRGVYGRTLIVDHGLGLTSTYGNLHSVLVNPGETVSKNQVVADLGRGGYAGSGTLIFQLRVHGTPVDPSEWWDSVWYSNNITSLIDTVKQRYAIPILRPLN